MQRVILFCVVCIALFSCSSPKSTSGSKIAKASKMTEKDSVEFGKVYLDATKEKILGNLEKAEELYSKALNINPMSGGANYELGVVYTALEKNEEAFEQFRIATKIEPDNKWYKTSYANQLINANRHKEAIKLYEELLKEDNNQLELKYKLAQLYFIDRQDENGILMLNEIEEEVGRVEDISIFKYRHFLGKNDIGAAANELLNLIDAYPHEMGYKEMLADTYLNNGKKAEALKVFEQMQTIDSNNYKLDFSLARMHQQEGDLKKYNFYINRAFLNPEMNIDEKVRYILTEYRIDGKDKEKKAAGIELCKKVVKAHDMNAKSHALLADFLYFDNQNKEALGEYKKTVKLDSSRFPVWNQMLSILFEQSKLVDLQNYGQRAIELFPSQPTVYLYTALGFSQDKNPEKAIEYLEMGREFVVGNDALKSQFLSSLGDNYHELEEDEKSDQSYDEALKLDPNNAYVLNNYSYYLSLRKEKLEQAKLMSKKSNELSPNQSSFQDTYAWIFFQLNEFDSANIWIDKALLSDGEKSALLLEHKGDILFKLGKIDEALIYWKKAEEKGSTSKTLGNKIKDKKFYE